MFCPPVIIQEKSLTTKVERLWKRVENVVRGRVKQPEKEKVVAILDKLFDITTCQCTIRLCHESQSGCCNQDSCKLEAHIQCSCPLASKLPIVELRWLHSQRAKTGEISNMMIGGVDAKETAKQIQAAKRKATDREAAIKRNKKYELEKVQQKELQEKSNVFMAEDDIEDKPGEDTFIPNVKVSDVKNEQEETNRLVDTMLEEMLGPAAYLVPRYFNRLESRRNTMRIPNTARASLRCGISPAAAATITMEFLKDLIAAGHLSPDMSYLACDRNKLDRARKAAMSEANMNDKEKKARDKIEAISYDGRRDKHTRAMVLDSTGRLRMRTITEEHESVTEEPSGRYLSHFVPNSPVYPEKPALKVAQGLYHIIQQNEAEDSLKFLGGDSTAMNTGHRGGTHTHLEKLLGRKLYWGICCIHTNELPLRHLIAILDGPTSSDTGFTGPVCSLLSKVNEMEYD